ncbi:MAG: CotH kinase family protein [Lachnospiraceae bacterium]|nr:CotH kinase family protein [Lachnospiraceae bacterium]
MASHKHINKIIIAVVTVAVLVCFVAIGLSEEITEVFGGTGVDMAYETKLFDKDELITVDIIMDEEDWNTMLAGAMTEEYYACDVVINGEKIRNVGIRPKGNTSLSAIVSDPDCDRYSLKLEFGHFVDGQTCYGLDKLILNNNYADATNMKEALIYDMFEYIGADASLYNYAEVSLNGEYRGVYLALEGVEKSFMLRNFGTQDGELYKPDSMEMGGGKSSSSSSSSSSAPSVPEGGFGGGGMPDMGNMDFGNMPDMSNFDFGSMPDMGSFDFGKMPGGEGAVPAPSESDSGTSENKDEASSESTSETESKRESSRGGFGGGGFSMGGGGANLNYSDDELDSYSTIWEGEITGTSKSDHRRVVTALKNISEGNDLEKYLDVDNVLKYMAVHTFAVNMDSLSGSMAHNYYLYEYDGQLNILPWDYNLSFGGMSMGSSGDATDMVNDAIDTPFSGTKFFDALLENEEYLAKYHEYLRQLAEEYVLGGRFDEVYNRIVSQIDELVKTDPTALYKYDEYTTAKDILYRVFKLRAESIKGQLDGTIPSTDAGQRTDKSNFVDASDIDTKAMGTFNMGGFGGGIKARKGQRNTSSNDSSSSTTTESNDSQKSVITTATSGGDIPSFGGDSSNGSNMPSFGGGAFGGMSWGSSGTDTTSTLILFGVCLVLMLGALGLTKLFKRKKWAN